MRFDGILKSWNDERGYGFIAPTQGGDDTFVHVSAFPHDGRRPATGEKLSFEIETGPDGRKRACNVRRPSHAGAVGRPRSVHAGRPAGPPSKTRLPTALVAVGLLVALGTYGYQTFLRPGFRPSSGADEALRQVPSPATPPTRCDGRLHCSQMTSCAEATFFLKNCPGTQMDGDGDGIPCEQQWCGS